MVGEIILELFRRLYDKCSSSASLALYLGNWVHISMYLSWNRDKLFPCFIKKVPFPPIACMCPPVFRLPLSPRSSICRDSPSPTQQRLHWRLSVGAAQGQRLAALPRPQGPVPACANPPTRLNFVNLQNFNPFSDARKINNSQKLNRTDRKEWERAFYSVQTFDLLWWPCEVVSTFALTCCPLPPIAMNATANRITCIQLGWDEKRVRYTQSI